jgi:K+-transporting ATPase ATPase C chain
MVKFMRTMKPALILVGIMTLLCGVIYPVLVTGIVQWWFPRQANGSTITVALKDGPIVSYGSELIAQQFTKPEYLIGRSMGTTNLSPVSAEQEVLVKERIAWWRAFDPENSADIPMDLVTASGSGVDPNISPEAAKYQISRIAGTRGIPEDEVRGIIDKYTTGRFLGFLGEPAVNVLKVNLALDGLI